MGLRVCLVTPFAWSQPHDVNEHVAGVAAELRALGHSVTVLAPSNRARDLAAGRRALLDGADADVVALAPALPISRRSRMGVPVGARASLSLALAAGRFDVVHGFEPGLPSLSYLALRDAQALAVATFLSPERLGYPPGRSQRERLLARVDALVATSEETAEAADVRFPGDYTVVSPGVDLGLFRPGEKRHLADIDVFEVYNARLLFDAYNDEALRFATKYNLTMGAGSDAHVLQGLGTGALRMRAFDGPEEFLVSLRSAQVLRRPKSLVYLQSLKWVAQAKERVR